MGYDGRILGAYIEQYLYTRKVPFEIEAFNKDEAVYVIDAAALAYGQPQYNDALVAYWYGMCRTLVGPEWFLWEEDSPEGKLRLKIAKKIDMYC
jgi:hypothetical protein